MFTNSALTIFEKIEKDNPNGLSTMLAAGDQLESAISDADILKKMQEDPEAFAKIMMEAAISLNQTNLIDQIDADSKSKKKPKKTKVK